jgi:monoamine oxidase
MPDVIVIGAGLAGLACATDLVARGADVTVLEARDRVGGRVFSHRFANGQVCERGAEFIDGQHHAVLELAAELGLAISDRRDPPDERVLVDAFGRFGTLAAASPMQLRVAEGRRIRTEYMLPPNEIGADFAEHLEVTRPVELREVHRIIGGNDLLARGLADRLGLRVHCGVAVTDIDAEAGTVLTAEGDRLSASTIVAAVPLPVLSRIWLTMPIELGGIAYGIGAKFSVQLQRRIWLDHDLSGAVLSDRAWGEMWETTDDQPGDSGVLTFLMSSHDGAAFATLPDAPRRMLAEIDRFFPGGSLLVGDQVFTDWTNDPYSIGAYVCFGEGQRASTQPLMGEQFGRLLLAGEHTDEFTGFMEGALRSGRAAALNVAL